MRDVVLEGRLRVRGEGRDAGSREMRDVVLEGRLRLGEEDADRAAEWGHRCGQGKCTGIPGSL